jgi:hypothetical protein
MTMLFQIRATGRRLGLVAGLLAVVAALAWVPAAGAQGRVRTCSIFHSNALEPHAAWRGYESGTNCGAATAVLIAVLRGEGQFHQGSDSLNSYTLYHGWKCGEETMGFQGCWRPSFNHARAGIAAIDCNNVGGCPTRYQADDPKL